MSPPSGSGYLIGEPLRDTWSGMWDPVGFATCLFLLLRCVLVSSSCSALPLEHAEVSCTGLGSGHELSNFGATDLTHGTGFLEMEAATNISRLCWPPLIQSVHPSPTSFLILLSLTTPGRHHTLAHHLHTIRWGWSCTFSAGLFYARAPGPTHVVSL